MATMRAFEELTPSLGARINPVLVHHRNVGLRTISPYGLYYRIWKMFLVILAIYVACISPIEIAFFEELGATLSVMDYMVIGFFTIDIVMTFFVAYIDKSAYMLVDNKKKIAKRYLRKCFAVDVICIIPFQLLVKTLPSHFKTWGYIFNIVRLFHLRRVCALLLRMEKSGKCNYFFMRCVKLICVTLMSVHCAGCVYYRIAASYHNPRRTWIGASMNDFLQQSLWARYVTAVYWSMTTLSTVGYGDFHPMNSMEMIVDIFYMLFNLGLGSYLIGNMTNLVVHAESRTRKFRDTTQILSSFARRNGLPTPLQDSVHKHLHLKFRTDLEGLKQQEALDSLPKAIRSSVLQQLFYSLLDNVYLFRGVSNDFLSQLVLETKVQYFPPKEDVILQNDAPTNFYILVTGAVDLRVVRYGLEELPRIPTYADLRNEVGVVGEAYAGDLCGEIAVLSNKPQHFRVQTRQLSQLLRLDGSAFFKILQTNRSNGTTIMTNFLGHLMKQTSPIMRRALDEIEKKLACGKVEIPVDLSFAIKRNYDKLLIRLLKDGLDPNEPDIHGSMALHIAAVAGNENCVPILMEYGADPDLKDKDDRTAADLASSHNHEGVKNIIESIKKSKAESSSQKTHRTRVIISCPEKGDPNEKVALLPGSFEELLELGRKKYGVHPAKIYIKGWKVPIEDINLITKGDHLVFVSVDQSSNSQDGVEIKDRDVLGDDDHFVSFSSGQHIGYHGKSVSEPSLSREHLLSGTESWCQSPLISHHIDRARLKVLKLTGVL